MKSWKQWVLGAVSVAALAMVLVGCGNDSGTAKETKVLSVGTHATYPPFEFTKDNSSQIQGFDYDLMNEVAKRMGYTTEWKNMGFDGLVPALQSGQLDVAIAGMNITEARKKVVDFSEPYYETYSVAMHMKGSPIQTVADLNGKVLGAEIGTAEAEEAKKIPGATVKEFNNIPDALNALQAGAVQAVLVDGPPATYYAKAAGSDKFAVFPLQVPPAPVGIAVSKQHADLVPKINKALQEIKADGTYQKLVDKWFTLH